MRMDLLGERSPSCPTNMVSCMLLSLAGYLLIAIIYIYILNYKGNQTSNGSQIYEGTVCHIS